VARLNTDGSLDASFSRDGKLTTTFGNFRTTVQANTIAIQADTKIVVGGRANGNFALVRYFANGNLDLGFSGDGKQTTAFGGDDYINDIVIQPDNKILLPTPVTTSLRWHGISQTACWTAAMGRMAKKRRRSAQVMTESEA
jgi:uncharacterized delta-60 repeat protein